MRQEIVKHMRENVESEAAMEFGFEILDTSL